MSFTDFVLESSLSRIRQHYKEHDTGTISACRGNLSKSENVKNTKALRDDLIKMGFGATPIKGEYVENKNLENEFHAKENSFFVVDLKDTHKLKKALMELGEKYDQDSVTFSDVKKGKYVLIGTTKRDIQPAYHKEITLGQPKMGEDDECYSSVKNRAFAFKWG